MYKYHKYINFLVGGPPRAEGRIEKIGPQPAKQIGVRPGPADPRDLFVVRDLIGSY